MNVLECIESDKCMGCLACIDACPCYAIENNISKEGFYKPQIDNQKCIMCGKCVETCPVYIKKIHYISTINKACVFQNANYQTRKSSTSGGFFSAVSDYIINLGGIIYGVAYDDNWRVKHLRIDNKAEISLLQGSKYVQSDTTDIYKKVKQDLSNNYLVCFSGTPCQNAALLRFLGKRHENLILIEVICHGVGSPYLWDKYISSIRSKYGSEIQSIKFRSKKFGYASSSMEVIVNNIHRYYGKIIESFKILYFKGYNINPSCFQCKFKNNERIADLSIFDCWHMNIYDKTRDDDEGTTGILINSVNGETIIKSLEKNNYIKFINRDELINSDGDMVYCFPKKPEDILKYWNKVANDENIDELLNSHAPYNNLKKIKVVSKLILGKLGISKALSRRLK